MLYQYKSAGENLDAPCFRYETLQVFPQWSTHNLQQLPHDAFQEECFYFFLISEFT